MGAIIPRFEVGASEIKAYTFSMISTASRVLERDHMQLRGPNTYPNDRNTNCFYHLDRFPAI